MAGGASGSITPNMLWQLTENILVVVGGSKEPTDREFADYYAFCEHKWPPTSACCLVVTGEAGLNVSQRNAINKLLKARKIPPKVAIVTDSKVVLGVVTALSWFNAGTKAFSMAMIEDALAHLDVSGTEKMEKILLEVRKMQASVAPSRRKTLWG